MEWVTCPKCGFTQIPSEKCLRCERLLEKQGQSALRPPSVTTPVPKRHRLPFTVVLICAFALLLVVGVVLVWRSRATTTERSAPSEQPTPAKSVLDLAGRWQTQISKTLPGPPPRPVVKEAFLETDRDGAILAAGVVLTDPGRGGAGAGYRTVPDGRQRLEQIVPLLSADRNGASLPIDFIPFPAWMPARQRLWRALEGQTRKPENVRYLLLESVEDDYLVQAGINQSGFLSYVFFSPDYASGRGVDTLSKVIHPDPGSSLRGFQNLVWDFSGAADFLSLEIYASLSGPEGIFDRLTLKR